MKDLESIYWDAVHEVDPGRLIARCVKKEGRILAIDAGGAQFSEDLSRYGRVLVTGMGKASARMAQTMEALLGPDLSDGLVITRYGQPLDLDRVRVREAGHPLPDRGSLEAARMLVRMAEEADGRTLIINLVSGGGSALFCLPAEGISLEDKTETTRVLLASGADIDEVNCVRKHLSAVKGGGFARTACPARVVSLILSDVVGDRMDTIASGITAPDPTTFADALSVLGKYSILEKVPVSVSGRLDAGARGLAAETPKPGDRSFDRVTNLIVGSNAVLCEAALRSADRLGYDTRILTTAMTGEAAATGGFFADIATEIASGRSCMKTPALVIAGGETTVTLRGKGKGGRNQETALAFACRLHSSNPGAGGIYFLSAGTDGSDGPTDAAGAFVTPGLMGKMGQVSDTALRHLADNDSYHFFRDHGLLFRTGPTHTNVCDLALLIVL